MIAFGPVPSRRLGQSLGINNIPPKVCTYTCVYCQLGKAVKVQSERQPFYTTGEVVETTKKLLEDLESSSSVDYLTIVPDGEPTLDINLKQTIIELRKLGYSVAVITNSSLLGDKEVRNALFQADWVSTKLDGGDEKVWRKVNAPQRSLEFDKMMDGLKIFSHSFNGIHVTETMMIDGYNDSQDNIENISEILNTLSVDISYVSIPTRPPAAKSIRPAGEQALVAAYDEFLKVVPKTEYLIGYEGNDFGFTGNLEEDILNITAVHPMREDAVEEILKKADAGWEKIDALIKKGLLKRTEYSNHRFYSRKL